MSKIYDFIKVCNTFYVLTINADFPAGRPFGAMMELGEKLYISTSDEKEVYKQIKANGNIQILALKQGTREWLRVTGVVTECTSKEIKEKMLVECPVLLKHYPFANAPHFNVFEIEVLESEFNNG